MLDRHYERSPAFAPPFASSNRFSFKNRPDGGWTSGVGLLHLRQHADGRESSYSLSGLDLRPFGAEVGEVEELGKWNPDKSVELCTDGKSHLLQNGLKSP